jgi:hypothetical protein
VEIVGFPSDVRSYLSSAPDGAAECSHGCSEAKPVVTSPLDSAREGAVEASILTGSYFSSAPDGAAECSHGCSGAEPVGNSPPQIRPERGGGNFDPNDDSIKDEFFFELNLMESKKT